jgi:DNA-binding transcriptional LysR family regulator
MQWAERIGHRLKLRELHVLMAVAQHGSMAKAARHLAISQPVVSKTILDLEGTLGLKLLDRTRDGIVPTRYGRALIKRGVSVFDELKQGVEELKFLADPTIGELRIGCTEAIMTGILPAIIARLHRRHPGLVFHLTQAVSGAALQRELRERNVDLIIEMMAVPMSETDLSVEPLFDGPMIIAAGFRSRWARLRNVELAELINEPWTLPRPNSAAGRRIAGTFRACGLDVPQASVICNSVTMHIALVTNGGYLTMVAAHMLPLNVKRLPVTILPIKLPEIPGPTGVITLKNRTISPVAQLFIDCAHEVVGPLAKRRSILAAELDGSRR